MPNLNEKARITLEFIINFQRDNGYSPSMEQIKSALNTKSTRSVALQLKKLTELKFIERKENQRRAIKILSKPPSINVTKKIKVPVLGDIKAGFNSFADQNLEGYMDIPLSLTDGRSDVFILKVKGESMLRAAIKPGDLIVVGPQSTALNGDIVVAYDPEDDTTTVKRFKKVQNYAVLIPESDSQEYKPKIGTQFLIQGKVISVLPS